MYWCLARICSVSYVKIAAFACSSFLACLNMMRCHASVFVSRSATSPLVSSIYPVVGTGTSHDDDDDVGDVDGANDDDDDDGALVNTRSAGSLILEGLLNLKHGTSSNMGAYVESLPQA